MKRENKLYLFVFFIFVLSLCLFIFTIYLKSVSVIEKIEFDATLVVGDVPGFNVDTNVLTFGTITFNTSSQRILKIKNDYGFPIKVEFSVEGDIGKFLVFDEMIFLDVEESRNVSVSTIISTDEKQGNYSGRFITIIKRTHGSLESPSLVR